RNRRLRHSDQSPTWSKPRLFPLAARGQSPRYRLAENMMKSDGGNKASNVAGGISATQLLAVPELCAAECRKAGLDDHTALRPFTNSAALLRVFGRAPRPCRRARKRG